MGQDIIKWSRSCQIQKFYLEEFLWESPSLRNQVLGAIVSNPALEELRLFEPHDRTSSTHEAWFDRQTRRLTFGFRDPHGYDHVDVENWGGFFSLFEPVLATKVSYLRLTQLDDAGFTMAWTFLAPLVRHSHVEDLSLEFCNISNDDATEIARAIHDLTTIRKLTIYGKRPSFEGAKIILKAAPPSLKSEAITIDEKALTDAFSLEECRELQILANERLCTAKVQRLDID
ncbi:hypothetical protein LEN26_006678 [Aphanomyces euteiches]|nr:hypothetical protein LEN26_006678 [Aphanomyces euteiches]